MTTHTSIGKYPVKSTHGNHLGRDLPNGDAINDDVIHLWRFVLLEVRGNCSGGLSFHLRRHRLWSDEILRV